jgi:hypothetical protein
MFENREPEAKKWQWRIKQNAPAWAYAQSGNSQWRSTCERVQSVIWETLLLSSWPNGFVWRVTRNFLPSEISDASK